MSRDGAISVSSSSRFSRRQLLTATGLGIIGLRLGTDVSSASATDDGVYPRYGWIPVASFETPGPPALMWPTLLPAGALTPSSALDYWYLWLWSHGDAVDPTTRLVLYTAPTPEGPYTNRGAVLSGMPTPARAGYNSQHLSAGDVVWDAVGSRYIASPHSIRTSYDSSTLGETPQDSFLIQSTNGRAWTWLDGNNSPRLVCGSPGTPDEVHTGYGRLLRDLDGHLYRLSGKYWWLYRAQRHDPAFADEPTQVNAPTLYRPWLASTPGLSSYPWTKESTQAFQPATTLASLFATGSFIRAASNCYASYCDGGPLGYPSAMANLLVGPAASPADLATSPQVPIALVPDASTGSVASAATSTGANLIRHPGTGVQYLVTSSIFAGGSHTVVTVYRSPT